MNKTKRIKYGISKLKKAGFSYIEIGKKIRSYNKATKKKPIVKTESFSFGTSSSSIEISWFKYLINLIKKIYVWFQKKENRV